MSEVCLSRLCECWNLLDKYSSAVPAGSPSRGGDFAVYVFDTNQPNLPNSFYFVLVSVSVFMALLTAFHSIDSLDNSPLSHSVLSLLFLLPYWQP